MALPTLTPEQRTQALAKAAEARKKRAEVKGELKSGKRTLADVLKRASGDDTEWERVAIAAHMDVFDESTVGLRELLLRRGGEPDTLIAIASRYL